MTWTCDQIEAQLSDYLEGLLQAPDREAFEVHVRSCAECGPLVAGVSSVMSELRSMEDLPTPPQLVYSILDNTLGPRNKVSGWQAVQKFISGLATPKFAYGAASVLATLFILLSASGISLRKPKLADLHPVNVYRNTDRRLHLTYAQLVRSVSDWRVVYEIQSRLRQDQDNLQVTPQESVPQQTPEKHPGQSDDHTGVQPKQQNRANELARQVEMLAADGPIVFERSLR
ncbi:MAG: zf-HC2 domain-containing protein [Candidatus Acidiferrum sp.]